MPCYHPLKGFNIGKTENGKKLLKIVPYSVDHLELINNKFIYSYNSDIEIKGKTVPFRSSNADKVYRDYVQIPCGQCIGCRMKYAEEWATRLMLELPYHDSAFFVTLTYDDFHLVNGCTFRGKEQLEEERCLSYYPDERTGEAVPCYSLRKRDFQLFMKRLRRQFVRYDDEGNLIPIRFYMCGEYGGKTHRPHFHAIIFGLKLDDLVPYKKNALGQTLYNSESFQKIWSDDNGPIGYAVLAEVSWESCAYVSRYVMKKQKGEKATVYDDFNLQPEFTLMSRDPGIAYQYFEDHPEIYDFDQINISTLKGGRTVKPPKYFDRIFDDIDSGRFEEVKANRREVAEAITACKMAQTSLPYLEMLAVEEATRKQKVKSLQRKEC